MTIDIENDDILVKKAGQFVITDKASTFIKKLIEREKKFKADKQKVIDKIIADGLKKYGDNFSGVKSADKTVSVSYAYSGAKYEVDFEAVDKKLVKIEKKLDTDQVENFIEREGVLPAGVEAAKRNKSIRITVK